MSNEEANGITLDSPPLVPSRVLARRRLVVVGGTGFLGKVWVAMILHRFPELEQLYLVVRPKDDQTADERFWSQIASSPVFDPLRTAYPGPAFEAFLRAKITVVGGDIVEPLLGFPEALVDSLRGTVDAVVNVAGVVDFNPPLDEALDVNAFGVNNLVSLARTLGASVMHTSTCYVAGYRAGLIEECDPREVPFPRAAGEVWFGAKLPKGRAPSPSRRMAGGTLDPSHWDPQREIDECLDLVKQARHRCEDAFRQSAFLDEAKQSLVARGEPSTGAALDDELAKVKRRFIAKQLVEAGKERALFWGWPNIYTYTKSIGEQALAGSGLPYAIVRPAVIESSSEFPFPGWNEGINTSAPFIYMARKGQVQFPGDHDVHLDIIPVDMVASGMIASLCELLEGRGKPVYQYGTTDTNACRMTRYLELIGLYKRRQVFAGKQSSLFDYVTSRFEPRGLTKQEYEAHGAHALASAVRGLGSVFGKLGFGPARPLFKPVADALQNAAKTEDRQGDVMDLFVPFTAEADWVFSCENTRAAMARMPPEERARFVWAPETLDWRSWLWEVHMPGLEKWVFPLIDEKLKREDKPLRIYETLFDLLDAAAERHDHAVALQLLEHDGLSRISFRQWRDTALAIAARLSALGVRSGDRVVIAGSNQPTWPIAYFGILRAGAVAVPIDPTLEARQIGNVVRSSGARLAVWTPEVERAGGAGARALCPDLKVLDLASLVDLDARSDPRLVAPDVPLSASSVASIIYTSGTTGEPKGVMLSHANFAALVGSLAPIFPLSPNDRVLSVLPLHHTFEFTCGLLLPLSRGARILYLGELSAERVADGLQKGRITAMVGVPALWQMLERRVLAQVKERGPAAAMAFNWALELNRLVGKRLGISLGRLFFGAVHDALGGHVRYLISGGAALPQDTAKLFAGLGLPLSEGYGLTEAAPVLTVSKASMKSRLGQVGKPVPGVELRIHEPDDQGVGEVLARGPNVMLGYFGDEAATSQTIDADGYLHTGDLGKLDKHGQLVIVGRQKDVIVNASGENVYPDDVEALLGKVEYIRELAIVGIDDARGGERVACLAVPEPETAEERAHAVEMDAMGGSVVSFEPARPVDRNARALRALREAFQKLPRHAQPAVVQLFHADLPRTATRKVKRSEVRGILTRLVSASAPPPPDPSRSAHTASAARHAVAVIANREAADLGASTRLRADLSFDSMMTMELAVALEAHTGRSVDSARLNDCETIADVDELLAKLDAGASIELASDETDAPAEPIRVPPIVADAAKSLLTRAQLGFYDRVMRPKVYGRAYIPHNRNTIVASNHSSHLDMGFVKYALGNYGQDLVSLAAQDYFFEGGRWRRAYFENLTNLAPFDRKGGLRQALRQAGELLERGKTILLFPEGTRSSDGAVHDFKPAIGHLALAHEVDILPIYLGGTFDAMPKGRRLPTKREIVARIGPPLEVADLRRLTAKMKAVEACRKIAELVHTAVLALRDGRVLDLKRIDALDDASLAKEHPLVTLFQELEQKYVAGRVAQPITYYFSLGNETEAKWTLRIDPSGCEARLGKPAGAQADCVLKTSPEIFTKIVREAYVPTPVEFMSGAVKSNDVGLLQTFQKVFDLA